VKLASGALASQSESVVLNGANAAAIRMPAGDWEVLQFAEAELVDEQTYRLSRLLRGQLGSEWTMGGTIPAGAPFVKLDAALVPLARGADFPGRAFSYRVGRASDDVGNPNMTAFDAAVGKTALLPWAPAQLRAARMASGIRIHWIRRTRFGGDSWDVMEVPLNEEVEAYRVEILHEGEIVRAIETPAPEIFYVNADELADFGAPQTSLTIRVAQRSAVAGAGRPRSALLHLSI